LPDRRSGCRPRQALPPGIGGSAFIPAATWLVADSFGDNRDRAVGLFSSILGRSAGTGRGDPPEPGAERP